MGGNVAPPYGSYWKAVVGARSTSCGVLVDLGGPGDGGDVLLEIWVGILVVSCGDTNAAGEAGTGTESETSWLAPAVAAAGAAGAVPAADSAGGGESGPS